MRFVIKLFIFFLFVYYFVPSSLEKLRPEKELERAKSDINRYKLKIRDLFKQIDTSLEEGRFPETLYDSDGLIDSEDVRYLCTIIFSLFLFLLLVILIANFDDVLVLRRLLVIYSFFLADILLKMCPNRRSA